MIVRPRNMPLFLAEHASGRAAASAPNAWHADERVVPSVVSAVAVAVIRGGPFR